MILQEGEQAIQDHTIGTASSDSRKEDESTVDTTITYSYDTNNRLSFISEILTSRDSID